MSPSLMNNKSILRKLQHSMLTFGIAMGFVFPIYANFFVEWKPGMFIWFFMGCMLAGLTVGLVSFWFVKIILIKKLKEVSAIASQIKDGDISQNINLVSNDEVGEIVLGLNSAVQNIRNLFTEILNVFDISEVILSNINNDNKGQKSAIDRINNCISIVTVNTQNMEELSHKIDVAVQKGRNITDCTGNQQMDTVMQVQKFSSIIGSLVDRSKKINDILKIIDGISRETNILALNASVEAARAGEYGKGFAVVAAEIRKLASSTSDSSQTISNNIKLIQDDVARASISVEEIIADVKRNNVDISSINKQFSNIDKTIHENLKSNGELNSSVNELNEAFNEVQLTFSELKKYLTKLSLMIGEYRV
jgi:methyl-accepting chemotaxis protein